MDDILADALAIQDRFVAEPMLKTTGRGMLKSRGVDGLQKDAEELRKKFGRATLLAETEGLEELKAVLREAMV